MCLGAGDGGIVAPNNDAAFQKSFPLIRGKTNTRRGKGRPLILAVVIGAARARREISTDVYSGTMSGAAFYEFYRSGVFSPDQTHFYCPRFLGEAGWLGGKHYYVTADNYMILYEGNVAGTSIYYNTQLAKPDDFTSYWDSLAPKWKGKIGHVPRAGSSFPSLTPVYYNPHLGPDFIKRLVGEMNVTVSRDRRQASGLAGNRQVCAVHRLRRRGARKQRRHAGGRAGAQTPLEKRKQRRSQWSGSRLVGEE